MDVLPQAVTKELAGLQDEVEPVDFQELKAGSRRGVRSAAGGDLRISGGGPLAAASLGQVHCGRLRVPDEGAPVGMGRQVAVKIQRPGIEGLVDTDLKAVRRVIDLIKIFTDWSKFADLDVIYSEFSDTVHEELDYIHEGHNAETIAANSAGNPEVIIPRIFWEHTTRRVLTLEFEQGLKITDYTGLEQAGVDRHQLARRLLQISSSRSWRMASSTPTCTRGICS